MAEKCNGARVVFRKDGQKAFIGKMLNKFSVADVASLCNCTERAVRTWRQGKYLMPYSAVEKLCKKADIHLPTDVQLRNQYWYVNKGAAKGGRAVMRKYGHIGGDPERRKQLWQRWWSKTGQYKRFPILEPARIKRPTHSSQLAEFTGILLGDGGISPTQVSITLNSVSDKDYVNFVASLVEELFDVRPSQYFRKGDMSVDLVISRVLLVRFCNSVLGLPVGNKITNGASIPKWIMKRLAYKKACLRGLIDTDGSVIIHTYKSQGKTYRYKKIGFTSRSNVLLHSVSWILSDLGIRHREYGHDIRIESQKDVQSYFSLVGSHNPKHLKRYKA
jgi:hypothetical protein